MMRSASGLLVLTLAAAARCATAGSGFSGSYDPSHTVNIATVTSTSVVQDNSSSLAAMFPIEGEAIDIALLANSTIPDTWLEAVAGYAAAADSRVLYQTASWSLIEDGTQQGKFNTTSFWARFRTLDPLPKSSARLSICAVVAEWENSWEEDEAALSAVDLENRLKDKCGENDTIALAFTSAVSDTAVKYLGGQIAINDVAASLIMHDVDDSRVSKAASDDRMFVRQADGLCPRDESNETTPRSSQNQTGSTVITVYSGEPCWPRNEMGSKDTSTNEGRNDSDWKRDLRFIIPAGVFFFVLGCAGLVYLFRQKKKNSTTSKNAATSATPTVEEKEEVSSLPYVLSMHQVA
ncbi:uncharacterized protein KRP23_6305 [Phytophthora ramorum]|nr:hypothetical protein KRP23_6305 [Phytophthora ramorum]